jgi:uncharacterized protein
MIQKDLSIARQFRERLETIPTFRRMVIFGSRARGDADSESDLDVFIEVSEINNDLRQQIQRTAWEIGFDNDIVISTLVASSESIMNGLLAANPILKSIAKEGIAI